MIINNDGFITVYGWMRTELNLKGNELFVYAVIYAFTQSKEQRCRGGLQFLADWCGATKQGVQKNLKSLIAKGLISKDKTLINGGNSVSWYATQFHGICNSVSEPLNSVSRDMQLSLSKKNNRTILDNKNNIYNRRFKPPSVGDIAAYCKEHSYTIDAQYFVDFYESKGWMVGKNKMKDWQAAVRTWARNNKSQKANDVSPRGVKLLPEDQRDHSLDGIF